MVTYQCCGHCEHNDAEPESLPPHAGPCQPEDGPCAEGSTVTDA
jgi:hypothetical protein